MFRFSLRLTLCSRTLTFTLSLNGRNLSFNPLDVLVPFLIPVLLVKFKTGQIPLLTFFLEFQTLLSVRSRSRVESRR